MSAAKQCRTSDAVDDHKRARSKCSTPEERVSRNDKTAPVSLSKPKFAHATKAKQRRSDSGTDVPNDKTKVSSRRHEAASRKQRNADRKASRPSRERSKSRLRNKSRINAWDLLRNTEKNLAVRSETIDVLRKLLKRLGDERQRTIEAERRAQEADQRQRVVDSAHKQARSEAARVHEQLKQYRSQLESAQQRITRANAVIEQVDQEKTRAESEAIRARKQLKKYETRVMIKEATEEGVLIGQLQGYKECKRSAHHECPWVLERAHLNPVLVPLDSNRAYDNHYQYSNGTHGNAERPLQYLPEQIRLDAAHARPRQKALPRYTMSAHTSPQPRLRRRQSATRRSILRFRDSPRGPVEYRSPALQPIETGTVIMPGEVLVSPTIAPSQYRLPMLPINRPARRHMQVPDSRLDSSRIPPTPLPRSAKSRASQRPAIPPEGYIPRRDSDGTIRLPPPHEMIQTPPAPETFTPDPVLTGNTTSQRKRRPSVRKL